MQKRTTDYISLAVMVISDLNYVSDYNTAGNTSKKHKHDQTVCCFITDNQESELMALNHTEGDVNKYQIMISV